MSLKAAILVVLVGTTASLRCQCSSSAGGIQCYEGWCEVHDFNGKVAACALARVGSRQSLACVRVKPSSGNDTCKVDLKNDQQVVRCWCRNQDYCNTDLADRIDEDKEQIPNIFPSEQKVEPTTESPESYKEEFVIEKSYDMKDEI
ncbi:hypothetical protein Q1695_009711 [Nippostrongylus brasiliensis]|nr:hypothetical protein Q1695_009711 [Nippostrongylus brasiliensis]